MRCKISDPFILWDVLPRQESLAEKGRGVETHVVPGIKKSTARTGTVVRIKQANVDQTSLVTTGHGAGAGREAAVVLVKSSDVDEARLVSTPRHSVGDEGRSRACTGQGGNNNGGELHLVVSGLNLNEGLGGD